MTSSRRQFVASSLAALPVVAYAPRTLAQQPQPASDPVVLEILAQMIDAVNHIANTPADSARQHASALRMLSAVAQRDGWDRKFNMGGGMRFADADATRS